MLLGLLTVLVYMPGVGIPYFADDFQFVCADPGSKILRYLYERNRYDGFYRPIQASTLAAIQTLFGWNTAPIHVVQIAMHIALVVLVYRFIRRMRLSSTHATVAGLTMVVAQSNASAVLGNDTMSQVAGTLFGWLSLWLLFTAVGAECLDTAEWPLNRGRYTASILTFALSLFSKETSPAFLLLLAGILLVDARRRGRPVVSMENIPRALPFVAVMACYMVVRMAMGASQPQFGSESYNFHFGANIPLNITMTLFAMLSPASTTWSYVAITTHDRATLAMIGAVTLAIVAATIWGLLRLRRPGLTAALAVALVLSMFPMAILNHISELYVYNSLPFAAALIGMGIGALLDASRELKTLHRLLAVAAPLLAAVHVYANWDKMHQMRSNGNEAMALLGEIEPHLKEIPPSGRMILVNPPTPKPSYSVFLVNDFNLFKWGYNVFWIRSGREDFTVDIVDQDSVRGRPVPDGALVIYRNVDPTTGARRGLAVDTDRTFR
jgi:hypothetical protein